MNLELRKEALAREMNLGTVGTGVGQDEVTQDRALGNPNLSLSDTGESKWAQPTDRRRLGEGVAGSQGGNGFLESGPLARSSQ